MCYLTNFPRIIEILFVNLLLAASASGGVTGSTLKKSNSKGRQIQHRSIQVLSIWKEVSKLFD